MIPLCPCGRPAALDSWFWSQDDEGPEQNTEEAVCERCRNLVDDCVCAPLPGFPVPEARTRWLGVIDDLVVGGKLHPIASDLARVLMGVQKTGAC